MPFTIANTRAFDHDPRFGLVMLSELASRALSPAVNDPVTAIAVLEAGTRVLAVMLRHDPVQSDAVPPGLAIPPFAFPDLIEDLYRPIARDGAGTIEVGIRLQKSLAAPQAIATEAMADCRNRGRRCARPRPDRPDQRRSPRPPHPRPRPLLVAMTHD